MATDRSNSDGTSRVGVVGAGPAGAGVAHALGDTDVSAVVFERREVVGGRAATGRRHGCVYDYGANYLTGDDRTHALVSRLDDDGLVDVRDPIWTFDAAGNLAEGERRERHRFTYESGLSTFVERVLDRSGATVHCSTEVASLGRAGDGWLVTTDDGDRWRLDALVLTPPGPATASILSATTWADEHLAPLREAAGAARYRPIASVVLHYPFSLDRPWYALVNTDRRHDVGWLSREECKPGHVPPGETLLVVQMSPEWTRTHDGADAATAASSVADLLDEDRLRDPDWADERRFRFALPDSVPASDVSSWGAAADLYVAGDWVVGEGRVHRAFWNGHEVGERVATSQSR